MKTWHHGLFRALFSFFLVLAALSPAFPHAVAYPVHIPASVSSPDIRHHVHPPDVNEETGVSLKVGRPGPKIRRRLVLAPVAAIKN
jgi:hypothetical protein